MLRPAGETYQTYMKTRVEQRGIRKGVCESPFFDQAIMVDAL
jgi:hypothetical protein